MSKEGSQGRRQIKSFTVPPKVVPPTPQRGHRPLLCGRGCVAAGVAFCDQLAHRVASAVHPRCGTCPSCPCLPAAQSPAIPAPGLPQVYPSGRIQWLQRTAAVPCPAPPPPPPPWTPGLQLLTLYTLYLGRPQGSARPPVPAATLTRATPMVCSLEPLRALRGPPALALPVLMSPSLIPSSAPPAAPGPPSSNSHSGANPSCPQTAALAVVPTSQSCQLGRHHDRALKPSGVLWLWTQVCLGPQPGPQPSPGRHTECSTQATSGLMRGPCGQTRLWGPSSVGVHMVPGPPATGTHRGL